MSDQKPMLKTGFIGLMGLPNSGKSTLVNSLVGEKVSIVSSKPQTTRQRVVGIWQDEDSQILLVDAPGLVDSAKEKGVVNLNSFLRQEFESVAKESDALLVLLNPDAESKKEILDLISWAKTSRKPVLVVISKVDLPMMERLMSIEACVRESGLPWIRLSHLWTAEEIREVLLPQLKKMLPESEAPLFDVESYTTQNVRDMAAEWIREQCFRELYEEIPFGIAVKIIEFKEPTVRADIIVNKENHKKIVIGAGGQVIKRIGTLSRMQIEKLVGNPIYLDLQVKVNANWVTKSKELEKFGYKVTGEARA